VAARSKAWVCGRSLAGVCGLESRRRQGCPSVVNVVCFQGVVCAVGRSLVQRIPTECVTECEQV